MQFPGDLVTFTEEIFNSKLHFLRSGYYSTTWLVAQKFDQAQQQNVAHA